MALNTLSDSPVLAPLARAGQRVGLDLELFGSVASRAILFEAAKAAPLDLFELAEHVADIDLGHNGPPSATPLLQAAIANEVPMAPWFRWSIIDHHGLAQRDRLDQFNVQVPLRRLRLGTRPLANPEATYQLVARALEGDVEISKGSFEESPRSSSDTECSAVLLYIDATLDVLEAQLRAGLPLRLDISGEQPRSLMREGVGRLASLLGTGRDMAIRRLWYRLAGAGLRMSPDLFAAATRYFELDPLIGVLENAGYPARALGPAAEQPVLVSAHLTNDVFRTPRIGGLEDGFGDWGEFLDQLLSFSSIDAGGDLRSEPIRLAVGNSAIAAIRGVHIQPGVSPSSGRLGPLAQDFIHIGLQVPERAGTLRADRLTSVVIGHGPAGTTVLPAFAQVSTALPLPLPFLGSDNRWCRPQRCTVRINLAGLVADKIDIFLVQGDRE